MMQQWSDFDYTENDLYQAVRLPYGNGAYLMTLFLPREGKTIGDVLATMDGSNWQFKYSGNYFVDLKMPRFKTETSLNLVKVMSDLGMPTAFTGAAEFPYFGNRDVFIGNMFQKAVIDLDEEGTKAAAITVIEATESDIDDPMPVALHANRPFFYVISERSTRAIFFIGQFTGQTPTAIKTIGQFDNFLDQPSAERVQSDSCYDLSGRKIEKWSNGQMAKGLYIIDGKKVVVR
jgi:serpin B